MAFNFCSAAFKTTVESDKVTVDGYEASNLVTNNSSPWSTGKGFLVENFVRSPANITFEFACNIEIERIVIHGVVGAQRSCGYEIFSRAQAKSGSEFLGNGTTEQHTTESKTFSEGLFNSIGKYNKLEAETFTFRNNRFRRKRPYTNLARMNEKRFDVNKHAEAEIRSRYVTNLTRVSHLTIRVNRVVPGCVAAIKWVEIWGQPAISTPQEVVNRILQIHKELIGDCDSERTITVSGKNNKTIVQSTYVPVIDETKVHIPNEFLDAITYEIMMIPMLLPSGYTVDKTTIERFNKEQASWGRVPNDPFTGNSFTEKAKPVSNAALKVRIDQFLLKNGSDIDVKSRTVGARSNKCVASVSSLVRDNKLVNSLEQKAPAVKQDLTTQRTYLAKTINDSLKTTTPRKRPASPCELTGSSKKLCSSMRSSVPVIDLTEEQTIDLTDSDVRTRNDHERNLSSTLDDALDSALSSLPTFSSKIQTETKNACVECGETFQSGGAYQYPCQHKVCRKCLTQRRKDSEIRCSECDRSFPRNSVVKIHL